MNVIRTLTSNSILNVAVVAWSAAQILKTLFTLLFTGKLNLERLVGAGGMPSSHSAMTCSLAIATARKLGFAAPEFALAVCFAAIVMYDAMGVRRAAGEQAKVLNKMIFEFPFFHLNPDPEEDPTTEEPEQQPEPLEEEKESGLPLIAKELKEFLGHTPMEVLGGCLLGILVAMLMPVG